MLKGGRLASDYNMGWLETLGVCSEPLASNACWPEACFLGTSGGRRVGGMKRSSVELSRQAHHQQAPAAEEDYFLFSKLNHRITGYPYIIVDLEN